MEIEPDGQQFLDARGRAQAGAGGPTEPPAPPPPPPSPSGGSKMTVVVVAIVVVVLIGGGVALAVLSGDDGGRRELETGPNADVALRERAETTTSTEPPETTTTAPATTTTVAPTDSVVPFPDFGPQPPAPPAAAAPACPGGGVTMVVTRTSATQHGNSQQVDIEGTATNNTTAAVTLDLRLTIDHDAVNHPVPWVTPVNQARPTLAPGETSTWTFSGTFAQGTRANVTALGGGFHWADPAHASCPTQ